jgi:hypothetical protein
MNKIPEWLEKWIAENEMELRVRDKHGDTSDIVVAVDSDDLRALLSNYRLCEREAARWMNPDTGETYASPENGDQPLYPEAKEVL